MLKPVYALAGSQTLLQLEHLARILAEMPGGTQRVDFDGLYAEVGDVLEELRTQPLFATGKVVVVRRADESEGPRQSFLTRSRDALEKHIRRAAGGSAVLVLRLASVDKRQNVIKAIQAVGQIIDCEAPRDLVRWAEERAASVHRLRLTPAAARALVELVGGDLGRLDNELAKLALACDGTADERAVLGSAVFQREQDIRELIGAVARGDVAEALRRWRLLQMDDTAQYRAATWLLMWLEDARAVLTPGVPFKNGWRYRGYEQEFRRFAAALGPAKVGRLIDQLAEGDWRTKTGAGDAVSNIERFLVALGR